MVTASFEIAPHKLRPASVREPAIASDLSSTICIENGVFSRIGEAVLEGLGGTPKQLPAWLFYDEAGSLLFEEITRQPEYYLTRIERGIFARDAAEMIALAAGNLRLRLVEIGAGSADKTRLLLAATAEFQGSVCYQPVDVSETALEAARVRLEAEHAEVTVLPQVADYTRELRLEPCADGEKRLVLFIGSSIGNFDPDEAVALLAGLRDALNPGDGLLLGVDLAPFSSAAGGKSDGVLIAAYDDARGVTASFNRNMLVRLNRELCADFDLEAFQHRIVWDPEKSRIEMHLESLRAQKVRIPALDLEIEFAQGETIHTENSYKYRPGEVEKMLSAAGFVNPQRWRDGDGWFGVYLATRE